MLSLDQIFERERKKKKENWQNKKKSNKRSGWF